MADYSEIGTYNVDVCLCIDKTGSMGPIIDTVKTNALNLYHDVMEERETFCYPPYCHVVYVYVKHRNEATADSAAILLGSYLRQVFAHRVLGPDRPAVARVKTLSIRKLVVKLETGVSLRQAKAALRHAQSLVMRIRTATGIALAPDSRYAARCSRSQECQLHHSTINNNQ